MTTYDDDNNEVDYDADEWKEAMQRNARAPSSKEVLLERLTNHLEKIRQHDLNKEKYKHKEMMLVTAIEMLNSDNPDLFEFERMVQQNSSFNEAIIRPSKVKELIEKTINFITERNELNALAAKGKKELSGWEQVHEELRAKINEKSKYDKGGNDKKELVEPSLVQILLVGELQKQYNRFSRKMDAKHKDKAAVIRVALSAIQGDASLDDLEKAKKQHPLYSKAFMKKSDTEKIIKEVIDVLQARLEARPSSPV